MHTAFLPTTFGASAASGTIVLSPSPAPTSIPFAKWPMWAKTISLVKTNKDVGIGDTVLRTIGNANSVKFKKWYKTLFGKTCGCSRRHGEWNARYRYA